MIGRLDPPPRHASTVGSTTRYGVSHGASPGAHNQGIAHPTPLKRFE